MSWLFVSQSPSPSPQGFSSVQQFLLCPWITGFLEQEVWEEEVELHGGAQSSNLPPVLVHHAAPFSESKVVQEEKVWPLYLGMGSKSLCIEVHYVQWYLLPEWELTLISTNGGTLLVIREQNRTILLTGLVGPEPV